MVLIFKQYTVNLEHTFTKWVSETSSITAAEYLRNPKTHSARLPRICQTTETLPTEATPKRQNVWGACGNLRHTAMLMVHDRIDTKQTKNASEGKEINSANNKILIWYFQVGDWQSTTQIYYNYNVQNNFLYTKMELMFFKFSFKLEFTPSR